MFAAATIFFAVVCLGPIPVAGIIGLITGVYPTEAQGGLIGHVPGYPAFTYLNWLILVPALAMLFLSVYTIPLPLKKFLTARRLTLTLVALIGLVASPAIAAAFFDPESGVYPVAIWAVPVFALAVLLFLVRALLGALKLVPEAWRTEISATPRAKATGPDA